jgi:hypothetical protein
MKQREVEFAQDICDVIFGFIMLVRYKTVAECVNVITCELEKVQVKLDFFV